MSMYEYIPDLRIASDPTTPHRHILGAHAHVTYALETPHALHDSIPLPDGRHIALASDANALPKPSPRHKLETRRLVLVNQAENGCLLVSPKVNLDEVKEMPFPSTTVRRPFSNQDVHRAIADAMRHAPHHTNCLSLATALAINLQTDSHMTYDDVHRLCHSKRDIPETIRVGRAAKKLASTTIASRLSKGIDGPQLVRILQTGLACIVTIDPTPFARRLSPIITQPHAGTFVPMEDERTLFVHNGGITCLTYAELADVHDEDIPTRARKARCYHGNWMIGIIPNQSLFKR